MGFCNAVGREAIEGLRFLASLPRAGAGRKKTQPFNWIHSRLFRVDVDSNISLKSYVDGSGNYRDGKKGGP